MPRAQPPVSSQPLVGPAAWRLYARFLRCPIRALRDAHREFGLAVAARVRPPFRGREIMHMVALGPDFNREVLGQPDLYRTGGQGIGGPKGSALRRLRHGLPRSQGEAHRQQRALVMPHFQKKAVDAYVPWSVRVTRDLLDGWRPGQTIDAWQEMRQLTLRISSDVLFHRDDPERSVLLGRMIGDWFDRGFAPSIWLLHVDAPGTPYRRLIRHAERIEREIHAMIDEKRAAGAAGLDVMSAMVRANLEGEPWMSDDDLVGQAAILFAASYETTSNALTWTLYLLAQHPEIAQDLADELDAALRGDAPSAEQLGALPLLDAVIRESMRILPSVPYTFRVTERPTRLGPYDLPRRARVICSHYITHRLPELYDDPERFLPRRWFEIKRNQYEYLPFSAGPRLCVGYLFALSAMKIAVAMILQRYRLRVVPGTRIEPHVRVTMAPRGGLPMEVHPVQHGFQASEVRGSIREMVRLDGPRPRVR